jgi:hypothetical protein
LNKDTQTDVTSLSGSNPWHRLFLLLVCLHEDIIIISTVILY